MLPYISRSKDSKTMKFGQLIEHNMINIFIKKSNTKSSEKSSPSLFFKKSKLSISLGQHSEILYNLILLYVPVEDYQDILKLRCWPLAFSSYNAFLKNKKKSEASLPASFSAWFLKKNIPHVIFDRLTTFYCLINFTTWNIRQYFYYKCLFSSL